MARGHQTERCVTAFEAKTRLGRLLDRVEAGEELIITRHGEPVAKLVPVKGHRDDEIGRALATFGEIRRSLAQAGVRVSREEIRAWRSEGRR